MTVQELPTLEEMNGWMYDEDNDPTVVTESDIDEADDLRAEDDAADREAEYWQEVRDCCGGRNFWCSHYRQYPPTLYREDCDE
jgi:hypothetical protein